MNQGTEPKPGIRRFRVTQGYHYPHHRQSLADDWGRRTPLRSPALMTSSQQQPSRPRYRWSVSKLVRRTHFLVALFLTPWMTMYALSTLVMHHRELLTGQKRRVSPDFMIIREGPYNVPRGDGSPPDTVAEQILADLGIAGAHSVRNDAEAGILTIERPRPIGSYRATFDAKANQLRLEKQRFGLAFFLEMLHRRRGFDAEYLANDLWALIVDGVIVAIMLWAATGIWMWFEMSRTRRLGTACLFCGSTLFAVLLLLL